MSATACPTNETLALVPWIRARSAAIPCCCPCMSCWKPAFRFVPISVTAVEIDPISFRSLTFSSSSVLKRASIAPPPDPLPVSTSMVSTAMLAAAAAHAALGAFCLLHRLMFDMRLFESIIFANAEGAGPDRSLTCGVVCRSHGCTLRPVCLAEPFAAQRQLSMSHTPVVASPTAATSSSRMKKVSAVNSTAKVRPDSFDAS